jgi:hypothetical protein
MPLLPTPKPQHLTRPKSAVLDHIRETAPDKIDVITHVTPETMPQAIALLRKITAMHADDPAPLMLIVAAPVT